MTTISAKYTYVQITNVYPLDSPTSKRRKDEHSYEFVALPVVYFLVLLCSVQAPYRDGDILLRGLFGVHQQPDH